MAYFDHNATAPLSAVARDAWLTAQSEAWHNPGAGYRAAAKVRASLELERERIAALLGAEAGRLVVTSGATEAANAVFAHLASRAESPGVVLLGATEHSCVRASAEFNFPGRVERLAHDAAGRIEVAALCARLREGGVAAVAVMAANNESGVLQPWRELAVVCAERGVPYVCDAVQWLGRLPAAGLGATDFLFASAHKFGGPKGVGLLLLPAGAAGRGFVGLRGGGQQEGRRSGTENWPALAATGAALAETDSRAHGGATAQEAWKAEFEHTAVDAIPGARLVGAAAPRLWNTTLLVLPAGEAQRWVTKLDRRGFLVSSTAACATAQGRGSAVLTALGWPPEASRRALRFSAGWETSGADWAGLARALVEVQAEVGAGPVVG